MATDSAIVHLKERQCKITGRIHKFEGVQPAKVGFRQRFMLHVDPVIDTVSGRTLRREQYYSVDIFSNQQADSRFIGSKDIKSLVSCAVYLNSWHWIDPKEGLTSLMRLNFIEWLKVD